MLKPENVWSSAAVHWLIAAAPIQTAQNKQWCNKMTQWQTRDDYMTDPSLTRTENSESRPQQDLQEWHFIMFTSLGRSDGVSQDVFLSVLLMSAHMTTHCFVNPSWVPDTLHFIGLRNPPTVLSTEQLFYPWFWPEETMPSTRSVCFCSGNRDSILKGWHFHLKAAQSFIQGVFQQHETAVWLWVYLTGINGSNVRGDAAFV